MKIKDILIEKQIQTTKKTVDIRGDLHRRSGYIPPQKHIGSGYYSQATDDKDEHLIKKVSRSVDRAIQDPYWLYADLCIEHQDHNSYFPRIYQYKIYRDDNNNTLPKIKIEKLIHYDQIDLDVLINYLKSIVDFDDSRPVVNKEYTIMEALNVIANGIENGYSADILDEKLQEAVKIIHEFYKAQNQHGLVSQRGYELVIDLHLNNVMFRRTNFGMQLVITDPFADSKY